MIKFRTEFTLPKSHLRLTHHDITLLIGSCFSDTIGDRLRYHGFRAASNPFGTVYNPISIAKLVRYCINDVSVRMDDIILTKGIWNHPDFHSQLGGLRQVDCFEHIQSALAQAKDAITTANIMFVTLGTSVAYWDLDTGLIVSNCHKRASRDFSKISIDTAEGTRSLVQMTHNLLSINANLNIVFTISPVRHIRDGIVENSRSKARLITMVDETIAQIGNQTSYFPSYELLIDDLRDYRYYADDMIHPSDQAINYVWDKFCDHYMDAETIKLSKEMSELRSAYAHRPFNPHTADHQEFLLKTHQKYCDLKEKLPWIEIF